MVHFFFFLLVVNYLFLRHREVPSLEPHGHLIGLIKDALVLLESICLCVFSFHDALLKDFGPFCEADRLEELLLGSLADFTVDTRNEGLGRNLLFFKLGHHLRVRLSRLLKLLCVEVKVTLDCIGNLLNEDLTSLLNQTLTLAILAFKLLKMFLSCMLDASHFLFGILDLLSDHLA